MGPGNALGQGGAFQPRLGRPNVNPAHSAAISARPANLGFGVVMVFLRAEAGDLAAGRPRTRPYFFGLHSRASFSASDIWAGVIFSATMSRYLTAPSKPFPGGKLEVARSYHA